MERKRWQPDRSTTALHTTQNS